MKIARLWVSAALWESRGKVNSSDCVANLRGRVPSKKWGVAE